ncbi:hypothetical protein C7S18_08390 [Ahniella affigens]|uniref:Protein kinase domain-containing protein n=1 Tax=Ahniella affigens TaxID=2021234 RepID=A0A2P1PQV3_9GAMM|nr:AarF/UbiB family protein [Ahniella affigens]AVP97212.1 hypothetical protein C7S18_08390 [Ahniella affigens]
MPPLPMVPADGRHNQARVLSSLPEPKRLTPNGAIRRTPPLRRFEFFHASLIRCLYRAGRCGVTALVLMAVITIDILLRRNSAERRARRVRAAFQSLGPTFIKLGQQLSARVDLVPYPYILELEKLLDDVPAFPAAQAIAIIERTTGRRLTEIFQTFDPKPIGSGSIACVFQAVLQTGEHVAVKVRRPGIGEQLAADLTVLRWGCLALELFAFPPGFTRNFVDDLRTMLFEELNFAREARFTELFRHQVKQAKLKFVSAPKVHHRWCSFEVLVSEFVSGVWMTDILHAVETQDQTILQHLSEQGIRPKKLARRVLRTSRFGAFEGWAFHADFHPANILVRPDNRLILIDFGSCGTSTEKERRIWRAFFHAQGQSDVSGMVRAIIGMLDPLPPVDLDEFSKRLEAEFWRDLHAHKSKHAHWWERTTTNLWIGFFLLTRQYRIPVNINILKTIRASLLSHTIAARLHPNIDHYAEFRKYAADAGRRARKRVHARLNALGTDQTYLDIEQGIAAARAGFERLQRYLDTYYVNANRQEQTGAFLFQEAIRGLGVGALLLVVTKTWMVLRLIASGQHTVQETLSAQFQTSAGWATAVTHPLFLVTATLAGLYVVRRLWQRLGMKYPAAT